MDVWKCCKAKMCKFILKNTSKIPKYGVTELDGYDFVIPFEWGSKADSVFQQNHIYDIFSIRIYQNFGL